jgi:uncharacterized protein
MDTVEAVMKNAAKSDAKSFQFSIHGGEPLLRKTEYLTQLFETQSRYLKDREVRNSIQTNGTLFSDEFISTYKDIQKTGVRLGLGVSLDGPKHIHDASRVYKKNPEGSYDDVMRGLTLLADHKIEVALLSVVNLNYADAAEEIYPFYKSLKNVHFLDLLIPRKDSFPDADKDSLSQLLCRVFDDWYDDDESHFEIRIFCSVIIGLLTDKSVLCTFQENCIENQNMISVAPDGEASFCDSFPQVSLGNAIYDPIDQLIDRRNKTRMSWSIKEEQRLEQCLFCTWYKICHGGCPADYSTQSKIGPYFCDQYKIIFNHIEKRLNQDGLLRGAGLNEGNINKISNPALTNYLMRRLENYEIRSKNQESTADKVEYG